jgi:hypothetical protein
MCLYKASVLVDVVYQALREAQFRKPAELTASGLPDRFTHQIVFCNEET